MGRYDEGLVQMDRAMALDPFFPGLHLHYGRVVFLMRDYDRAVAQFARMLELYPTTRPRTNTSATLASKKR